MEYKRIYEQGKKIESMLDQGVNDHVWEELNVYRQMLDQWERGYNNYHMRGMINDIKDVNKSKGDKNTIWRFVTINPPDGMESAFIAKVHKFMTRKCMSGQYVFEQRGEVDGDYHGLHIHALVKYYVNLKRDLLSQFKKFCDGLHINIKVCTEKDYENRLRYISGEKKGDHKKPKVENDSRMRKYYGLKDIYTC